MTEKSETAAFVNTRKRVSIGMGKWSRNKECNRKGEKREARESHTTEIRKPNKEERRESNTCIEFNKNNRAERRLKSKRQERSRNLTKEKKLKKGTRWNTEGSS